MNDDRRIVDQNWKRAVDEKLRAGVVRFEELADGQQQLLVKLDDNTRATKDIAGKLDAHVAEYKTFTVTVQPALDAIATMQAGVRVLGKIGGAVAWVGNNVRKLVVWVAPIIATGVAVWHFITGNGGKS